MTIAKTRVIGWPSVGVVKTTKLDLSNTKEAGFDVNVTNINHFVDLAENTFSVPRDQVIKILFAAYLLVNPYQEKFTAMIETNDTVSMKKILHPVFNAKVVKK